jgi:hypothetical protein
MNRDDLNSIRSLISGAVWFVRAGLSCMLVFLGYILFLPIQLIMWVIGKQSWSETAPYLYLDYLFTKGVASPQDNVPEFETWKRTRYD